MVKDYSAHLIDAQQAIVLMAKEYQGNYLQTRLTRECRETDSDGDSQATDCKIGEWILCGWQGLALGETTSKEVQPCWRGPFSADEVATKIVKHAICTARCYRRPIVTATALMRQ